MKFTLQQQEKLQQCLAAMQDKELLPNDAFWVNQLLEKCAEARVLYIQSVHIGAHLNWDFGITPGDADYPEEKLILGEPPNPELLKTSPIKRSKIQRKKRSLISQKQKTVLWVVAPLLLLGFFWGGFHLIQSTFSNKKNEVVVIQTHLLQTQKKQKLTEGEIEFVLPTGVKVLITAPATFQITGENEITLTEGMLLANVTTEK
ncbi:hypothetical protein MNBD_PLANCTO02-1728, partial [hydrothermal vent metagenome]